VSWAPFAVAAWLFVAGLYGIVTSRHLVRLIVCLTIVQASTYVLLLGVGYLAGAPAPIYYDIAAGSRVVDPVVQALCLTDVVVEVTVTALLLSLAVQAHKQFGTADPAELRPLRG
jgi:multicomponent Na+:H+ antiporter subunit C